MNLTKYKYIVVEFKEKATDSFAFKFAKKEVFIGTCDWCNSRNILNAICKCGNVRYCNEKCLENDIKYHIDKCTAAADKELDEEDADMLDADSR